MLSLAASDAAALVVALWESQMGARWGAGDGPGTGPPSWPLQINQINTKRSGAGTARDGDSLAGLTGRQ